MAAQSNPHLMPTRDQKLCAALDDPEGALVLRVSARPANPRVCPQSSEAHTTAALDADRILPFLHAPQIGVPVPYVSTCPTSATPPADQAGISTDRLNLLLRKTVRPAPVPARAASRFCSPNCFTSSAPALFASTASPQRAPALASSKRDRPDMKAPMYSADLFPSQKTARSTAEVPPTTTTVEAPEAEAPCAPAQSQTVVMPIVRSGVRAALTHPLPAPARARPRPAADSDAIAPASGPAQQPFSSAAKAAGSSAAILTDDFFDSLLQ